MIDAVYVLQRESGLTLFYKNFNPTPDDSDTKADLFSGALQGIRMLLKECKIGDLNEFTTHNHRTEIRFDDNIAVVITADLESPSHEQLDQMTDDLLVVFSSTFQKEIAQFSGDINKFSQFDKIVNDYFHIYDGNSAPNQEILEESYPDQNKIEKGIPIKKIEESNSQISLTPIIEWLKNRFEPEIEIQENVLIQVKPDGPQLPVNLLLDNGEKKLGFIDKWMASHIGKPNYKEIILIFELNPSHGPKNIRQILDQIQYMGDPSFKDDVDVFPWFPTEILFMGPGIQKSTFEGLENVIKKYRDQAIIVPNYADHIHREHFPHHAFYRCKISGWRWKGSTINSENYPQQIFPKAD